MDLFDDNGDDILNAFSEHVDKTETNKINSIKEELRFKIQSRRILEGQEELEIDFDPPKKYQLTPEEERKAELRKHRNRQSANKSRIKRKWKFENLLQDEEKLLAESRTLKVEIQALQKLKYSLETVLANHFPRCSADLSKDTPRATADSDENQNVCYECSKPLKEIAAETSHKESGSDCYNVTQNRACLYGISKDKKIDILKAYLKDNQ